MCTFWATLLTCRSCIGVTDLNNDILNKYIMNVLKAVWNKPLITVFFISCYWLSRTSCLLLPEKWSFRTGAVHTGGSSLWMSGQSYISSFSVSAGIYSLYHWCWRFTRQQPQAFLWWGHSAIWWRLGELKHVCTVAVATMLYLVWSFLVTAECLLFPFFF